jgi:hypothetical protein
MDDFICCIYQRNSAKEHQICSCAMDLFFIAKYQGDDFFKTATYPSPFGPHATQFPGHVTIIGLKIVFM